jgi:hypothetical protein
VAAVVVVVLVGGGVVGGGGGGGDDDDDDAAAVNHEKDLMLAVDCLYLPNVLFKRTMSKPFPCGKPLLLPLPPLPLPPSPSFFLKTLSPLAI